MIARATLFALNSFIKHCPHMIELGFELENITREAVGDVIEAQTRPQGYSNLTTLGVGSSLLDREDCHIVASLLSLWFPQRVPHIFNRIFNKEEEEEETGGEQDSEVLRDLFWSQRSWAVACMYSDDKFWAVRVEERLWRRRQKRLMTRAAADVVSDPSSTL